MNKIIWEPINLDFIDDKDDSQDEDEDYFDEDNDELSEIHEALKLKITKKVYHTPFGIMDISNKLNPYKTYHMWIMNTNFNLSSTRIQILSEIEGIEVLKPLSRYRAIIAVGKCFSFSEVRQKIHEVFKIGKVGIFLTDEAKQIVAECKNYKYWGLCMMPNGKIDYVTSDDIETIQPTLDIYKKAKESHIDTVVLTHESQS
jgi:hypothetical protein